MHSLIGEVGLEDMYDFYLGFMGFYLIFYELYFFCDKNKMLKNIPPFFIYGFITRATSGIALKEIIEGINEWEDHYKRIQYKMVMRGEKMLEEINPEKGEEAEAKAEKTAIERLS